MRGKTGQRIVKKSRKARRHILDKITESAVRQATRGKSVCVVCGPKVVDSEAGFLAAMQYVGIRFPQHFRYVQDVIEEVAQEQLSDETRDHYERVFMAVDAGNAEIGDCRRAVGIDTSKFDFVIGTMADYGLISFYEQGGKTNTARGGRKKLIRILKRDLRPVSDLVHESDGFGSDDDGFFDLS